MKLDRPASNATIQVTAPARLHMGFLDPDGHLGRRFGSIGLAISEPSTKIRLCRAQAAKVSGPEQARVAKLSAFYQHAFGIDGHFDIAVESAIPAHAGLGSGTQLALAIGAALQATAGQPIAADDLGAMVNRGARSAIGIAAFTGGGFIVDGGKLDADRPPPVICRADVPDAWRIVLAFDRSAEGIHGEREREAFSELKPLAKSTAAHLSHITLMQMVPALHNDDLDSFGDAITEMQTVIGEYFAPAQGGRAFSSPNVEDVVQRMGQLGGKGLGQSSWGPTGFAFFESADAAERLYTTLVEEAKASGVELLVVQGRNVGAKIEPV